MIDSGFDRCVSTLYESVLDPTLWSAAFGGVAEWCQAAHAGCNDVDFSKGVVWRMIEHNIAPEVTELYLEKYASIDPRIGLLFRPDLAPGELMSDNDAFQEEFRRTDPFYREFLGPLGATESAVARFAIEESRMAVLVLIRSNEQGRMSPADRARTSRILPHLDCAIRLSRRLSTFSEAMAIGKDLFQTFDEPVAAVTADGSVRVANIAFERLLARGNLLVGHAGRVRLVDTGLQRRFAAALRDAAALAAGDAGAVLGAVPTITVPRARGPALVVSVAPLVGSVNRHGWFERGCALVKVSDPTRAPSRALLERAFRLTPAEARLCEAVMGGGSLAEIAARLRRSVNTVKTQLASVYAKTGTRSRQGLVVAIWALPR